MGGTFERGEANEESGAKLTKDIGSIALQLVCVCGGVFSFLLDLLANIGFFNPAASLLYTPARKRMKNSAHPSLAPLDFRPPLPVSRRRQASQGENNPQPPPKKERDMRATSYR